MLKAQLLNQLHCDSQSFDQRATELGFKVKKAYTSTEVEAIKAKFSQPTSQPGALSLKVGESIRVGKEQVLSEIISKRKQAAKQFAEQVQEESSFMAFLNDVEEFLIPEDPAVIQQSINVQTLFTVSGSQPESLPPVRTVDCETMETFDPSLETHAST